METLDLASMNIDQLKAHIELLNISLINVERNLRDQREANCISCGRINLNGMISGYEVAEQQRFCLQRQKEELLINLKRARDCLRCRQMHGE